MEKKAGEDIAQNYGSWTRQNVGYLTFREASKDVIGFLLLFSKFFYIFPCATVSNSVEFLVNTKKDPLKKKDIFFF